MNRFMKWPVCCGSFAIVCLLAVGTTWAQDQQYYINNAIVTYPGTSYYPPVIDATNFINLSSFTVNFTDGSLPNQTVYETWDTLNYTNLGILAANTGFEFDNQSSVTGSRTRAASFENPGQIYCASAGNDPTDPFFGALASEGYAQCLINSTNIHITGVVDTGADGLIQISGQNIDLTQSLLNIEGGGANADGTGSAGLNTNFWDPSQSLGPNSAQSSPPINLTLFNSTPYFQQPFPQVNGTNIIRAVFIEDFSVPSVAVSVYFNSGAIGLGNGDVTVQWAGNYLDPATGNTYTNYLYLNDDYVEGASTNAILSNNGIFNNFVFTETAMTPYPGLGQATPPGYIPVFLPGAVTNRWDYGLMSLLASRSTNTIANESVTNLPGRVEIHADSFLNLSNIQITGQSYMSLVATNEFAGSGGALIQTPYADINLGTTNGILYVTNTMQTYIPFWGGVVQAWNTEFVEIDTNTTDLLPGTNDYRVLIIASRLTPTILAQVQDLILHDYHSNNIVISDSFNVMRTFTADAQSLTLTTNIVGAGATSFEGELNLETPNILLQTSLPNLRYLTNDGAFRMQNLAYFGNPFVTNIGPPTAASGVLSEVGTNVVRKDKVTIGSSQYMFVPKLTNTIANQVLIVPSSFDASLSNLIAAINGASGSGVAYSTATKANSQVTAGPLVNHAVTITDRTVGTAGNSVATTFTAATSSVNLSWGGHATLYGGALITTNLVPYLFSTALINNGVFMDQGAVIYAGNFESGDVFSNGIGSFTLNSLTTTLTNGFLSAGGDVSITASNLVTSNLVMIAGRSLTLTVTNLLTDTGPSPTNNNIWTVGYSSVGSGFNLPIKPSTGDLLGTTITLAAPTNRNVVNIWAGQDRGVSNNGYTNNAAVGQLILDVANSPIPGHTGSMTFNPAGVSNALYVDLLVLTNAATQGNSTNLYNFPWLHINPGMMIYYANATENGVSVAEAIDVQSQHGANGGRLRWVYSYAGYYSSTNIVYPDGTTNTFNTALAQSITIDSDSDGTAHASDPTRFFVPSELNFMANAVGVPPMIKIQWTTIPNATNFVYFATNMMSATWLPYTNFNNWYYGNNVAVTNAQRINYFRSPQMYIKAPGPDNYQQTNVWVYDTVTNVPPRYYRVRVAPWLNFQE